MTVVADVIPAAFAAAGSLVSGAAAAEIAGTGITASQALGATSALVGGISAFSQARYEAGVLEQNAKLKELEATRATQAAQEEQFQQDQAAAGFLGEQLAAQGASGVQLRSGSFMLTRKAAKTLARQDALNIRQAGDVQRFNSQTEANNFRSQAAASRRSGLGQLFGSFLSGASTLVGDPGRTVKNRSRYVPTPIPRPRSLAG